MRRNSNYSIELLREFEDKADELLVKYLQTEIRQSLELLLKCYLGQKGVVNFKYIEFTTSNAIGIAETVPKKITNEQYESLTEIFTPFIDSDKLNEVNIDFKWRNGVFYWG